MFIAFKVKMFSFTIVMLLSKQLFINNPKLEEFRADLDKTYREKEHILSESEEKINVSVKRILAVKYAYSII